MKVITTTDREYYIDGIVLKENGNVKSYRTATGYATPTGPNATAEYFYHVKDWLGSVRVTIDAAGTVLNGTDYYPYGKKLPGRNAFNTFYEGYRYQFTGHEFDGETGYQYHGAKYYSEELGRYMSVDPLAQKFHAWSSYSYVFGNPVRFIDPDGKKPQSSFDDDKAEKKLQRKYNKLKREGEKLSEKDRKAAQRLAKNTGGTVDYWKDKFNFNHYFVTGGTEGTDQLSGEVSAKWQNFSRRAAPVYDEVEGWYFNAGDAIGVQVSIGGEFFFVAGMSYSADYTFVGDSWATGCTIGGGMGMDAGFAADVQIIFAEKNGRYKAKDVQEGQGFEFSAGIAFINYTRSGDIKDTGEGFEWYGNNTTGSNFVFSTELLPAKALSDKAYNAFWTCFLSAPSSLKQKWV